MYLLARHPQRKSPTGSTRSFAKAQTSRARGHFPERGSGA